VINSSSSSSSSSISSSINDDDGTSPSLETPVPMNQIDVVYPLDAPLSVRELEAIQRLVEDFVAA
jgi:hypothetical protein